MTEAADVSRVVGASEPLLREHCPVCEGRSVFQGSPCYKCRGQGYVVRGPHDVASSLDAPDEREQELARLRAESRELYDRLQAIRSVVEAQAEDDGLWFKSAFASEAYLQRGLRELHEVIEGKRPAPEVVAAIVERWA
jgi:DnaJ-class molecular chaperone